jgi:Cu+-exporting ATPase
MSQYLVDEKIKCTHCGDDCPDDSIRLEDTAVFCCEGCKTVYEILSAKGMCTYYDLSKDAGLSLKGRDYGDKYAFLDNAEISRALLDYADAKTAKVTFHIPAMHCSSCIWLLENLYKLCNGVGASRTNFLKKEVAITFDPAVLSLRKLTELLTTLGYEPHISLEDFSKDHRQKTNRQILLKLGIVGFCTGNSMILAFPEYFGISELVEGPFRTFFTWISALLSLPVFLYGASGFLTAAWRSVKERVISLDVPLAIGISALFFRSWYELLAGVGPGFFDSLAGLVFFLLIGKWVQGRTYEHLSFERNYQSYFPLAVTLVQDGEKTSVPVAQLKPGDHISIRNQELIPADSILMSDFAWIDYSFVTGEAEPVKKGVGDYLYAGGRQIGTQIDLVVQKPVSQSYLTQLWNHESFRKEKPVPVTRLAALFSRYFTIVTLLIASGTAVYWYFVDQEVMWGAVTAVLIVACPCALSLAMPFTMGTAMGILGRNKFYVKSPDVLQHMAVVSHVVFDKTGTLTQNKQVSVTFTGKKLTDEEKSRIKSLVSQSVHPLSRAIGAWLGDLPVQPVTSFREIPGKGIEGTIAGKALKLGSFAFTHDSSTVDTDAHTQTYLIINGEERGSFGMGNQYRNGLMQLVAHLRTNVGLSLLSGDNAAERDRLLPYFGAAENMRFNQSPADKLAYVESVQARGNRVLMVGDGLNDAGALRQAEVGVAITEDVNAFFPASDALLEASQFNRLGDFIGFSRSAVNMVKISFLLSVVYNIIGLSWAVSGQLSPVIAAIFMPLSSLSVVLLSVFGTKFVARQAKL